MNLLVASAIKISIVIGLGLLAAALLRHRSAAVRHWILAVAVIAAATIPALMVFAPSWSLPRQPAIRANADDSRPASLPAQSPRTSSGVAVSIDTGANVAPGSIRVEDLAWIVGPIWLTGVALNLGALLIGLVRLTRVAARARDVREGPWAAVASRVSRLHGLPRPVRLLQSDQPALLVTWGYFAPKVVLPVDADSWSEDRIYVVLAHELAHVRRGDWVVQLGGELLRAVYWFNPILWLACARLRQESEHACDDAVVNLGVQGSDYATHLLELALAFGTSRHRGFPAPAITPRPSSLQRRISAMLNAQLNRRPMTAWARAVTVGALLLVAVPIALFAQNTFASVSGSIVDESNGRLPGVSVLAIDAQRGARHQVVTNRSGRFEFLGLPQGSYVIEAQLPGFETFRQRLTLEGQDVQRDITLQIGSLSETVTVSSGASSDPDQPVPVVQPRPTPVCTPAVAGGIGGQIRVPRKITHVAPRHPSQSASGVVALNAVIGADGVVKEVRATNDAPPDLVRSAIDAVRQWQFDATLLNCVPVDVRMSVTVAFQNGN